MPQLCCIGCNGLSLTLGGREHTVRDSAGRLWRFEQHPYCGPIILRNNGNPKSRQPGCRSAFWPAYEVWRASQAGGTVKPQSVPFPG